MSARRVLIVDQGESFGGSAVVAGVIANRMPPSEFEIHVATAIDPELLRLDAGARTRVLPIRKAYGYVDQAADRGRWSRLPVPLRRMAGRGAFLARMGRNAGYVREIARYLRRNDIGILHLNNGFENHEAHLAGALAGRRILVHAHGPCGSERLTAWLARRADQCVAISAGVGESLRQAGARPDRVTVVPNPLTVNPSLLSESDRPRIREKHGIPVNATVLGIVGRIIPWKGQLEFLRAAAVALKGRPDAHAVVVGDVTDGLEAYGALLRLEVTTLGIEGRVTFTGFIADPREVYGLIDIMVHSSIEPEPFGLVLTEAMAYGIPVVAADRGGPLEIVTDGRDGFLRDPRDPEAVGATLIELLENAELRSDIGARARATALARFDPDAYVTRLAEVYTDALYRARD